MRFWWLYKYFHLALSLALSLSLSLSLSPSSVFAFNSLSCPSFLLFFSFLRVCARSLPRISPDLLCSASFSSRINLFLFQFYFLLLDLILFLFFMFFFFFLLSLRLHSLHFSPFSVFISFSLFSSLTLMPWLQRCPTGSGL